MGRGGLGFCMGRFCVGSEELMARELIEVAAMPDVYVNSQVGSSRQKK